MNVAAVVANGRSRVDAIMLDTCTITRPGGAETFDPETGETVPTAPTTIYTGRCSVRAREVSGGVDLVAGQAITVMSYTVSLPWDATGVEPGDSVTITAANDPGEVGRRLTVGPVQAATQATQRRLLCSHDQG